MVIAEREAHAKTSLSRNPRRDPRFGTRLRRQRKQFPDRVLLHDPGRQRDACPSAGTLGGCKTPVNVTGGADVQLHVTFFYYPPSPGSVSPTTTQQVQQLCTSENGTFVAAP
jgi:hypothetical protein